MEEPPPIDTLKMKQQLTNAAFTDEQAHALIEMLKAWSQRMATKEDLERLRIATQKDIDKLRGDLAKDMESLRSDLTKDMDALRSDLTKDMSTLRSDLTKQMYIVGALVVTLVSAVNALL